MVEKLTLLVGLSLKWRECNSEIARVQFRNKRSAMPKRRLLFRERNSEMVLFFKISY